MNLRTPTRRLLTCCFITLLAMAADARAGEPDLFRTTPAFGVGNGPTAITSCDLNGDGLADAISANESFNDIAVLLSDGKGGFHPQVRFGVGRAPRAIACADFDGDDNLDIVTANWTDNTLSILRGNGDGTFRVGAVTITVQDRPESVAVGQLNDDEIPDIVVGSTSVVRFRLGNGDFTFGQTLQFAGSGVPLTLAHVDDDEHADVVVASGADRIVRVLWGQGNGTFDIGGSLSVGGTIPSSIAVADIDEDEVADLLVSNGGGASGVAWLRARDKISDAT